MALEHRTVSRRGDGALVCIVTRRAGPTVLVAFAFGVLATLPVIGPGDVTPARAVGAVILAVIAGALARVGRTRATAVATLRDGSISVGDTTHALSDCRLVLGGDVDADDDCRFRVALELPGGELLNLIEQDEPASVLTALRDSAEWLRAVPVRVAWRVPDGWQALAPQRSGSPSRADGTFDIVLRPTRARMVGRILVGGAVGLTVLLPLTAEPMGFGDIAPLSLVLSAALVSVVAVLAAAVLSYREQLSSNGQLVLARRALGITWSRRCVARADVHAAHPIGPSRVQRFTHFLFETERGPLSFPVEPESLRTVSAAVARAYR